ncbi:MAG TPA: glycosyltransferase [Hyphomicrobium sp.]|nr:glycosyltransferase [Hyphomicrobium sp.]
MNVLFLSMTFPDAINPERGTYNLEFCAALARRHNVSVIAPRSWHEWLNVKRSGDLYEPSADTKTHGVPVAFPVFWYLPRVKPDLMGRAIWQSIRGTARRISETFRPDVVVSYWAFPDADGGLHAARHFDVPSVVIAGGSDVLLLPKEPGRGPAVRRVLTQSSMVTTVSEGLKDATIALGVPPSRAKTIRQGVNPRVFHHGDKALARTKLGLAAQAEVLVWVGRMVPVKNLDLLIDAVKVLAAERANLTLHLIGDGASRAALQARVEAEGLSRTIKFEGAVAHDRLPDWYRAADAVVLSSHSEGLPNVLRESLACGTPFVATDVGDIGEIARQEFSQLVASGDTRAFAAAIANVLKPDFSKAAAQYQARNWDDCANEYSDLLEQLVSTRKAAAIA